MTFIKWEKKFDLGIDNFDNQHKEIIELVNQLYEKKEGNKSEILKLFKSLLSKMDEHFKDEETLMKEKKIVQFISHKLEHARALQKYSDYYNKLSKKNIKLDTEILESLKNWFEVHLEKKDKKLIEYVT